MPSHVLSDCITSYDKKKLPELLAYYESKGCARHDASGGHAAVGFGIKQ